MATRKPWFLSPAGFILYTTYSICIYLPDLHNRMQQGLFTYYVTHTHFRRRLAEWNLFFFSLSIVCLALFLLYFYRYFRVSTFSVVIFPGTFPVINSFILDASEFNSVLHSYAILISYLFYRYVDNFRIELDCIKYKWTGIYLYLPFLKAITIYC